MLLLDGGDFSMGTLFHTVTRETGGELRLMSELGYDAATLGNHEFDFRSAGLAAMISSAHTLKGDALMPLLSSNLGFDPQRSEDDSLQPAELYRYAGPLQWGVSLVLLAGVLLILWLLRRRRA